MSPSHHAAGADEETPSTPAEEAPLLPAPAATVAAVATPARAVRPASMLPGLAAALGYITLSSAMIMANKYLMHPDRFPFATTLAALHMAGAWLLGALLRVVAPSLFPSAPSVFGGVDGAKALTLAEVARNHIPFFPVGVCFALALVASNSAYRYASVSFLQMMKEGHVVLVYALMVVAGLEVLRLRYVVVLLFVAGAASAAVYGEIRFSWIGFGLQLLAGICESAKIVVFNKLMSSRGSKMDSLTVVLCAAPVTLAALCPLMVVLWEARIPERMALWAPQLVGSVLLAFALQVATATTIFFMNGTALAVASIVKDLSIVISATLLLGDSLTPLQSCGFAGSVAGIAAYSAMKQYPQYFEAKKDAGV